MGAFPLQMTGHIMKESGASELRAGAESGVGVGGGLLPGLAEVFLLITVFLHFIACPIRDLKRGSD